MFGNRENQAANPTSESAGFRMGRAPVKNANVLSPITSRLRRRNSKKNLEEDSRDVIAVSSPSLQRPSCLSPQPAVSAVTSQSGLNPRSGAGARAGPVPATSSVAVAPSSGRSSRSASVDEVTTTKNPLPLLLQNVHHSSAQLDLNGIGSPRRQPVAPVASGVTPVSGIGFSGPSSVASPAVGMREATTRGTSASSVASPAALSGPGNTASPSLTKRKGASGTPTVLGVLAKRTRLDNMRTNKRSKELSDETSAEEGGISKPFNVVHCTHVGSDLQWTSMISDRELFKLEDKLGEGAFGVVYKARYDSGYTLVVKEIAAGLESEESLRKEIEILKSCRHANIVQYFGSCVKGDKFWILMEYCGGGSLRDTIEIRQRTLSEDQIASAAFSVIKGLIYLHSRSIIHRDIKAANILLNENGEVKLADFGVSEKLSRKTGRGNGDIIGTPLWMAPEVARAHIRGSFDNNSVDYHRKSDVWALGITIIELADGLPPFVDMSLWAAVQKISQLSRSPTLAVPSSRSPELNHFISQCLVIDVDKRPFVHELLAHPFVTRALTLNAAAVLVPLIQETQEARRMEIANMKLPASDSSDWIITSEPRSAAFSEAADGRRVSAQDSTAGGSTGAKFETETSQKHLSGGSNILKALDFSTAVVNEEASNAGAGEYAVLLRARSPMAGATASSLMLSPPLRNQAAAAGGDDPFESPALFSPPKSATVLLNRFFKPE